MMRPGPHLILRDNLVLITPPRRLMVDPKQRKVVLVENVLMPTIVKSLLYEIMFGNLQVASVSFLPSHLLSTLATGRMTSLVLDLGYQEASLLPVQFGRCLTSPHLLTSPRAGKRLSRRLRALLLHFATFIPPTTNANNTSNTQSNLARIPKGKVPQDVLTPDFLDEVKAKALFVAPSFKVDESEEETTFHQTMETQDISSGWTMTAPYSEQDEASDEILMELLGSRYKSVSRARDMLINLPLPTREHVVPATQPSTIGAPPSSIASGRGSLIIPGWIRERAAEVFFEEGDEDDISLVDMILHALVKVSGRLLLEILFLLQVCALITHSPCNSSRSTCG
jgi:actin-related protein 10